MSSTHKTVIAFDLYGTLLSTESIATALAEHLDGDSKGRAATVAALWRRYQLEYTWRMNSMGLYEPFSALTLQALQHALLQEAELELTDEAAAQVMRAYDALHTFPDVDVALAGLSRNGDGQGDGEHIDAYVFTNGTEAMVRGSVFASPSLAPHAGLFKALVTVEPVRCYKPDRRVYEHLARCVGKGDSIGGDGSGGGGSGVDHRALADIWLVSGNPFDIVGARAAGLSAVWVDRAGGHHGMGGWNDRLGVLAARGEGAALKPTLVVKGVDEAVDAIRKWTRERGGGGGGGGGGN